MGMSMPIAPGPIRPPHPARHVFSAVGLAVSTILILAGFFAAAFYVSSVLTSGGMAAVISSALVDLANDDRESEDLPALAINPVLVEAAQAKANDMAAHSYFAHVSPDGIDPWHWFAVAGYEYAAAGENLAVNFSDSKNVEEAWMNSPAHRANILSGKFTEIGIATAVGEYKGKKTTFVVQMFGTPRASARETAVETVSTPSAPEEIAVAVRGEEPAILGSEAASVSVEEGAPIPPSPAGTSGAPPLPSAPVGTYAGPLAHALASPAGLLRTIYLVCGFIVLLALILTTRFEFRPHHVRHVAAAAFLLVLMAGALAVADRVIFTEPVIAEAAGN
jgi:uncharacterized protein YkwD